MLFFRRKPDPHVEQLLGEVEARLRSLLEAHAAGEVKTKRSRDSVEAGARLEGVEVGTLAREALAAVLEALEALGWRAEVEGEPVTASEIARRAGAHGKPLAEAGLGPARVRAGFEHLYRALDAGGLRFTAVSPGGEVYEASLEAVKALGFTGVAFRLKKSR